MRFMIGCLMGLVSAAGAEPLLEGRVLLSSGAPAPGARVRLFAPGDLGRSLGATADESGYFAFPLKRMRRAAPLPARLHLGQNYPNPFNPSTIIPYQLPAPVRVRLEVFNILGQRVATLVDGERPAGFHTAAWDATDASGRGVASGVYLYRLLGGGERLTRSMVLLDGPVGLGGGGGSARAAAPPRGKGPVYGLTVSGPRLVPYVDPAFRMGGGPVEIQVQPLSSLPRGKVAVAGGLLGDVDGNGRVDLADALLIASYSEDPTLILPNGDITLGDVNRDGQVDLADARLIEAYHADPSDPSLPQGIGAPVEADAPALMLYWTDADADRIQRSLLDGSGVEDVIDSGLVNPRGLAVDEAAGKLYWTDYGSDKIQRANLDGSQVEDLVTAGLRIPLGLALDTAGGKLYWTDNGSDKIQRANLDGSEVEDLATGLQTPLSLALDTAAGKLYWTDSGADKIQRSNLDGSEIEGLVTGGLDLPRGLAVDAAGGKLYWTDNGTDKIQRANLDGSEVEELVTEGLHTPRGLALDTDAGKLYWTDSGTDKIQRANLDGSEIEDLVTEGLLSPRGLALVRTVASAANRAPVLAPLADRSVAAGDTLTLAAAASDPDGDALTYTASSSVEAVARVEVTDSLVTVYALAMGRATIAATARDPEGLEAVQTFSVLVGAANLGPVNRLYWTDAEADRIRRAHLDGSGVEDVVDSGLVNPRGLAVDETAGKLYWTDYGSDRIQRSNLDGSEIEDLVTEGLQIPLALALDAAAGKLYWTDNGTDKIQRSNLDGSEVEDLVTGLRTPLGLALDAAGGKLYWTDSGADKIQRAHLDGSQVEDLVTTGLQIPRGLALDSAAGKLYWADSGTDRIQRANLDGTEIEDLVTTGLGTPRGLALDVSAGKLYWADSSTDRIQRANLDGTEAEDLVTEGLLSPRGLVLVRTAEAENQPPALEPLADRTAATGDSLSFQLFGSDPNGDALTYTASSSQEEIATVEVADSLVTLRLLSVGEAAITVTAGDPAGLQAVQSFTVTVQASNEPPVAVPRLYWTDAGSDRIQRAELDGSDLRTLVTGLVKPRDLALDRDGGRMYWSDSGSDKIQRAHLDGSHVEDLVVEGLKEPFGLALDAAGGKLYWSDYGSDRIQRAELDGSKIEDLVATGLQEPYGLDLDIGEGRIYWTDWGSDKIQRAHLDGSEIEDLVTGLQSPLGLVLDAAAGRLYWTDNGSDKIQRSNLDGSQVEDLVTEGLQLPRGLALDAASGRLYWIDNGSGKIQRSHLDGSQVEDLVTSGLKESHGLALGAGLPAQILNVEGEPATLNLAGRFRDPEGSALTLTASSSDEAVAAATLADSVVTIVPVTPGRVTVSVAARDEGGRAATLPVAVTVYPANRPPVAGTLADRKIRIGSPDRVDLSDAFTDPDEGDVLIYMAASSNEAVATTAAVEGTGLRITPRKTGQTRISVTARDPKGLEASLSFRVTVEPKPPPRPPRTPPGSGSDDGDGNGNDGGGPVTPPPPTPPPPPPTPPPPTPPPPTPPTPPPPDQNNAPTFDERPSATRSVAENTEAGEDIGNPVTATDSDDDRLTYNLEGTDAGSFTLVSTSGQLRTRSGVIYDYETKPRYSVSVKAEDGHGGSSTISVIINLNDVNEPPSFTSDAAFEAAENQSLAGRIAAEDADNADGITGYTLTGGADRDLLEITLRGTLTFKDAPNFEDPADNGRNNSYIVVVTVTGGAGGRALTAAQTITVTVTNESEPPGKPDAPTLTSPRPTYLVIRWTAPENSGGTPITGYDLRSRLDGKPSYVHATVTTGTATTVQNVQNMPPGTAVEVQVRAINDDGPGEWSDSGFGSVQPNKLPTFDEASPVRSFAENTGAGQDVGEPLHVTDDYIGSGMAFSLEGTDAGSFDIVTVSGGRHGQLQTKEGVTYDYETKNSYSVTVKVVDPQGGIATVDATIELIDADEPPGMPGTPRVEASTLTSLTLSWTAPDNTGRPAIAGYDVQYRTGAGTFTVVNYDGTDTRATVGSLTANTEYELQVRARNADGDGGWSDPVSGTTSDNQPPVFTVDGRFEVEENETTAGDVVADDADAEDSITGYEITGGADQDQFEITSGNTLGFRTAPDFDRPADLASTVPASEAGDNEYIVEITATSGAGDRVKTTALPIVVTVTNVLEPPGKIDMPAASASVFVRALSVEWSVPENDGPDIDRYEVQYRIADSGDAFAPGRLSFYSTAAHLKKADVHYLKTNTRYEVQVRGANAEGPGEWSESAFGATYNGPPFVTPLGDRTLTFEGAAEMVPLWYGFRDGQDMAWFAASSNDDAVATARVAGSYLTIRPVAVGNASVEITGSDNYGETAAQTINVTVQAATLPDPTAAFDADNEDLAIRFTDRFEAGETRAYDVRVRQQTPLEVLGKVRVGYKGDYITGCIEQSNPETGAADISIVTSVGVEPGTTYEADYRYRGEPCTERDYSPGPWSRTVEYTTSGTSVFDVEFVFKNFTPTAARKAVFDAAEARWERIIRNSLPDFTVGDEVVDDLRIEVELSPQALGSAAANVKILRFESHLPAVSWMKFDETFYGSLSDERLKSVILHEMAHALGFSATAHRWKHYLRGRRKYDRIGDEIPDTHFLGPLATAAFNDAGGADYAGAKAPVENGVTRLTSGSVDHHWRESVLGDELMTSLFDFDEAAPLSAVTIQALADIGYVVDVTQADPYTLPETSGSEGAYVRAKAAGTSGQAILFRCVVEHPAETETVEEQDAFPSVLESTILETRTLDGR